MSELKDMVLELIIDTENCELKFDNLSYNVQKWPEISIYNEDEELEYQVLSLENCDIIEINDDYIELIAGGEYQSPHLVRIEVCAGELTATYFEPANFITGLDYDEVLELLQS